MDSQRLGVAEAAEGNTKWMRWSPEETRRSRYSPDFAPAAFLLVEDPINRNENKHIFKKTFWYNDKETDRSYRLRIVRKTL